MILWEAARIALRSIAAHKLRSLLNLLGVIIAVATILAVVSVVSGLNQYAAGIIGELGPNTVIFSKFGIITSRQQFLQAFRRRDFTLEDLEAVRRLVPQARRVAGEVNSRHPVYGEGSRLPSTWVRGTTPELPWMVGMELADGRYFSEAEERGGRPVAVVGAEVRDELFPHVDPLGRMLRISGKPFRIIGTLGRQGQIFGHNRDRVVVIPLRAYLKAFGRNRSVELFVEAPEAALRPEIEDAVRLVLRSRKHALPRDPDPFGVIDATTLAAFWRTFTFSAFALVTLISSISLVVGGVAVANTMFASVVERTLEIGLRKAVGARPRDLRRQFLFESVALTLSGGAVGVALGWAVSAAVGVWSPLPTRVTPALVATGLGVATLSGALAGWLPALRASRMDPVAALREE